MATVSPSRSEVRLVVRASAGASLVVLCAALFFSVPLVRDPLEGAVPDDLLLIGGPAAVRIVFGVGTAGGTWLVATAWSEWRARGGATATDAVRT